MYAYFVSVIRSATCCTTRFQLPNPPTLALAGGTMVVFGRVGHTPRAGAGLGRCTQSCYHDRLELECGEKMESGENLVNHGFLVPLGSLFSGGVCLEAALERQSAALSN